MVVTDKSSVERVPRGRRAASRRRKILAADDVSIAATRTSAVHVSTLGAAAGFVGVGAAVVVINVTGTDAGVRRPGRPGRRQGGRGRRLSPRLKVSADGTVTAGPFGSATTMGVALAAGAGAVSAGVVVVTIGSDATRWCSPRSVPRRPSA